MKYTNDIIQEVIMMYKLGNSSRKIAQELLGSTSKKSTVNDIINRHNRQENKPYDVSKGKPNILYIDLETAPTIAAVFGRFDISLSQDNVLQEGGFLISACWKFEGDENVTGVIMTPDEISRQDDSRIVASLYEVWQKADVVVGQNIRSFDDKVFRTRCLLNGFAPPKTVKIIDTLQMAKKLRFNSNKLDSLGFALGCGRKVQNSGISLWVSCLAGNLEALHEMFVYNKQDVQLLQDVYLKLRAYDPKHPNLSVYYNDGQNRCVVCGSTHVHPTGHSVFTQAHEYEEHQCGDCGHRSKFKKAKQKTGVEVVNI
jgi:DNA-directed RNA polymerase subunit RPC12/RpoP